MVDARTKNNEQIVSVNTGSSQTVVQATTNQYMLLDQLAKEHVQNAKEYSELASNSANNAFASAESAEKSYNETQQLVEYITNNAPTIETVETAEGVTITTTDLQGTNTVTLLHGDKGEKGDTGEQGIQGIQGVQGERGADGVNGIDGKDGKDGADGYSPTAKVTKTGDVSIITITDQNGTTSVEVLDGAGTVKDVQQNGVSVIDNGIANIIVPTKTSEITNDSGFITINDIGDIPSSPSLQNVSIDNKSITKNANNEIQSIGTIDSNGNVIKHWVGTKVEYDLIETKDQNTIYNITDDNIEVEQDFFIPAGTILTVETDGSGNFTNLSSAIDYLKGKYSNGSVTIKFGNGTFEENSNFNVDGLSFNISSLIIEGNGSASIIKFTNSSTQYASNLKFLNGLFTVKNLTLQVNGGRALYISTSCQATCSSLTITGAHDACLYVDCGGKIYIGSSLTLTNGTKSNGRCINCYGGFVNIGYNSSIKMSNSDIGIHSASGGIVQIDRSKYTVSSVTTIKTTTNDGVVWGSFTSS